MTHAAVIGGGSWGTALAKVLADKGERVVLWGRDQALVTSMHEQHENTRYLPGIRLPHNLTATNDLHDAVHGASLVLMVVPSHTLRDNVRLLQLAGLPEGVPIVSASNAGRRRGAASTVPCISRSPARSAGPPDWPPQPAAASTPRSSAGIWD